MADGARRMSLSSLKASSVLFWAIASIIISIHPVLTLPKLHTYRNIPDYCGKLGLKKRAAQQYLLIKSDMFRWLATCTKGVS